MIFIESYILNPLDVRGGENILEPITTFGGYKSNVTINSDGSGTIVYNNSDYTISLSNDCLVGSTSVFTLSNVSSSDTVKMYEDDQLISTTTGNSVSYTPSLAGEHEIYFKVNNVSTSIIKVNVYTLTSTTVNIPSFNDIVYLYTKGSVVFTVKPNLLEDVVANNIPCTIRYFDQDGHTRTYNITVSNLGTQFELPGNLWSSDVPATLTINCAGETLTYDVMEYFSYVASKSSPKTMQIDIPNLIPDNNLLTNAGLWNEDYLKYKNRNEDDTAYLQITGETFANLAMSTRLEFEVSATSNHILISNLNKSSVVSCNTSDESYTTILIEGRRGASLQSFNFDVYQDEEHIGSISNNVSNGTFYIGIPSEAIMTIKSLLYGVL